MGLAAWLDPAFYRWAAWFWLNSLAPGWAETNHEACRQLAWLSMQCRHQIYSSYIYLAFILMPTTLYKTCSSALQGGGGGRVRGAGGDEPDRGGDSQDVPQPA